ncbi:META domain-containing protein [Rubrivirga sp. IMCC45206]|uniref:META domain-containing protein n=1 Tax=Rubrivirga sp. IMCC45206 TaxID=3391614 RepID=UPI00398FC10A
MRLLAVALLALAACQPSDSPGPPSAAPEAVPLLGTEWRLAALDGDSLTTPRLLTLGFSDEPWDLMETGWRSLGGYDGCNDFGVGYTLNGERFRVGGGIMSNAMACGPPGDHISDSLHTRLNAARTLRIADGRLRLLDSLGVERLAFVPRPVRPVDSTAVVTGRWQLDPAASTVTNAYGGPAARYHVAFAPDGTYRGGARCVTFTGEYRLDGDRLSVSSFSHDDQACAPDDRQWTGPDGLEGGEVEADDDRLVIHTRRGTRAVFVRP